MAKDAAVKARISVKSSCSSRTSGWVPDKARSARCPKAAN